MDLSPGIVFALITYEPQTNCLSGMPMLRRTDAWQWRKLSD